MLSEYNSSLLRYLQRIAPLNQAEAELKCIAKMEPRNIGCNY